MVKKQIVDNDEVKTLSLELQAEILKLKGALSRLEANMYVLQNGENNEPYWNGKNAYETNKVVLGHIDHDKTLIKNLDKCFEHLDSIIK